MSDWSTQECRTIRSPAPYGSMEASEMGSITTSSLISSTGPGETVPADQSGGKPVPLTARSFLVTPGSPPTFSLACQCPFGLNAISDGTTMHNVIETMYHYDAVNGTPQWSDTNFFTLQGVETSQYYSHGTYYLQLVGYQYDEESGLLTNTQILPLCDPNRKDKPVDNLWVVQIDNRLSWQYGPERPTLWSSSLHGPACLGSRSGYDRS